MKNFMQWLNEMENRSAFVYMTPKEPKDQFAQCATCVSFISDKNRCVLFGEDDEVVAEASCTLYAHGEPPKGAKPQNSVSLEQAGYVVEQVRCENCKWFDSKESICDLYVTLNKKDPKNFQLDINVDAKGCCNGWER